MNPKYTCHQNWVKFPSLVFEIWCLQSFRDALTPALTHSLTDGQTQMQYASDSVFQRWRRHRKASEQWLLHLPARVVRGMAAVQTNSSTVTRCQRQTPGGRTLATATEQNEEIVLGISSSSSSSMRAAKTSNSASASHSLSSTESRPLVPRGGVALMSFHSA